MTQQSDAARLEEIRQKWEQATPFERELHLAAWEEDIAWLIALASRAVEADQRLEEAARSIRRSKRVTGQGISKVIWDD